MKPVPHQRTSAQPSVWYLAAGYKLPAGIEAYLLHYATELRNQGFDPRIIVFEPLPKVPHRFLVALRERGIPIESLYEKVGWRAKVLTWITYVPWRVRGVVNGRRWAVDGGNVGGAVPAATDSDGGQRRIVAATERASHIKEKLPRHTVLPALDISVHRQPSTVYSIASLLHHWLKRLSVRELKRMIERERPNIIHVKGRIICEAFAVLPSDRTIYQHALMGTRDPSWTDNEAEAFSRFLNRIARVLVQGKGIAETFAHAFQINRSIDVVFTMAPDEVGGRWTVDGGRWEVARSEKGGGTAGPTSYVYGSLSTVHCQLSARRSLRFGILCRFTEQKGIVYILEALRMFRERHGAVDFTFAGQGPMESSIRSTVDSWESEPQQPHCERTRAFGVRQFDTAAFLSAGQSEGKAADTDCRTPKDGAGAPSREADISPLVHAEVRIVPVSSAVDILTNLDVFVHPGLDDAMPVSIVEALMCGVPCIVSDVGASPELVRDGVEGRVIQPASSEAILLAMEWFQERTVDELNVLRRQARRRYEDCCAPEIIGGQVAEIYRDVMGEGGEREM